MRVVCEVCGKDYEERTPVLTLTQDGRRLIAAEQDNRPVVFPTCRHRSPLRPKVVTR